MLNTSRLLLPSLVRKRCLCISSRVNFKFKLTEEISREFEATQAAKEKPKEQEYALATRESPLIMGRVSSDRYKSLIKVGVPKHRFNSFLVMFIRETDNVYALDQDNVCNPGDWVLLRRQSEPIDDGVVHKVERRIFEYGRPIDPLTGRRSFGRFHDDDIQYLEHIKVGS